MSALVHPLARAPRAATCRTHLVTTVPDLEEVVAWLLNQVEVGLDCEANGKDPRTAIPLLWQLGNEHDVYVIVLPAFTPTHLRRVEEALRQQRMLVVGHNLNYDYKLLRSHYGLRFPRLFDTMLAEALLTSGDYEDGDLWLKQLALKVVAEKHLGLTLSKEERETFLSATVEDGYWMPTEEQVEYAASDVSLLLPLMRKQLELLKDEGLVKAARLRFAAVMPLAEVELRGMVIDQVTWRTFLADLETQRDVVKGELEGLLSVYEYQYRERAYFEAKQRRELWEEERDRYLELLKIEWKSCLGEVEVPGWGQYKIEHMRVWRETHPTPPPAHLDYSPINLNSHDQVKRALNALGLELEKTDRLAREKALRSTTLTPEQRHVLEVYAQYTKLSKLITGFGENVLSKIDPETGRLHTSYNIGLTGTGRMSSKNPNFQNMPRINTIRHAFLADEDMLVVTADFKSQELVVSAALSGDERMRQDLREGKDLYKLLACDIFSISLDEVSKEQRQMCKNALLGITYGLTPVGMERQYGVLPPTGKKLIEGIKKRYPKLVRWSDQQATLALTRGYVTTASGAKRYFHDKTLPAWRIEKQGRNAPVQGTAADIVYRMAFRLDRLTEYGIYPANYVHDEAVVLVPKALAEDAQKLIVREMQAAFNDLLPVERYGMTVGVDCHIADHWTKD